LFNFRIYVVNSRHLIPVLQKASKTVSFHPFQKLVSKMWVEASETYLAMHDEPHQHIAEQGREQRRTLAPGKGLDYQNLRTGRGVEGEVIKLAEEVAGEGKRLDLYAWVQHLITVAASDGRSCFPGAYLF
jgi:hypothetical protein